MWIPLDQKTLFVRVLQFSLSLSLSPSLSFPISRHNIVLLIISNAVILRALLKQLQQVSSLDSGTNIGNAANIECKSSSNGGFFIQTFVSKQELNTIFRRATVIKILTHRDFLFDWLKKKFYSAITHGRIFFPLSAGELMMKRDQIYHTWQREKHFFKL